MKILFIILGLFSIKMFFEDILQRISSEWNVFKYISSYVNSYIAISNILVLTHDGKFRRGLLYLFSMKLAVYY